MFGEYRKHEYKSYLIFVIVLISLFFVFVSYFNQLEIARDQEQKILKKQNIQENQFLVDQISKDREQLLEKISKLWDMSFMTENMTQMLRNYINQENISFVCIETLKDIDLSVYGINEVIRYYYSVNNDTYSVELRPIEEFRNEPIKCSKYKSTGYFYVVNCTEICGSTSMMKTS